MSTPFFFPLQLIASAYILNHAPEPNSIPLYPYLHSLSNIRSREDLLTPCYLPDVNPNEIAGGPADFSFAAGDFLEVYGDAPGTSSAGDRQNCFLGLVRKTNTADAHRPLIVTGSWDVCVTCFFLDTARNVVEYLQTIHGLLKPGGLWINCGEAASSSSSFFSAQETFSHHRASCNNTKKGPTLWHFENDRDASSLELPLEDVKAVARKVGFEISVRFRRPSSQSPSL